MLVIREEQIKTLEKAAAGNYILELAKHCREFSPELCKTLKDRQLHSAIRKGIEWAEEYGFTKRGPVRFYVDMMIVLGSGFDTDPQYPWIGEILDQEKEVRQMDRSEELSDEVKKYLAKVDGENNVHTLKALEDLSNLYRKGVEFQHQNFEQDMLLLMEKIHPRKFKETGEEALLNLIKDGKEKARKKYKFSEARSIGLMVVLMFAFGHKCDSDPFLPWIAKQLNKEDTKPETIAKNLESRAMIWLDAVLQNAKEAK